MLGTPARQISRSGRRESPNQTRESIYDTSLRMSETPAPPANPTSSGSQLSQASYEEYQEWMKMVRNKRVKANNAFSIPLIDAFHSMVQGDILSQDGLAVTFQEATHTLGGCLTIYKNRIARVKDDTNKLLVGVSDKNRNQEDTNNDNSDEDEDGEPSSARRRPRARTGEKASLEKVEKLSIDTEELDTAIDPLLRKMSADFDKRTIASLLLARLFPTANGTLVLYETVKNIDELANDSLRSRNSENDDNARLETIPEEEPEQGMLDYNIKEELGLSFDNISDNAAAPSENGVDAENAEQAEQGNTTDPTQTIENYKNKESVTYDLGQLNVTYYQTALNSTSGDLESLPLVESISKAVEEPKSGTEALAQDLVAWSNTDPGNDSTYDHGIPEEDFYGGQDNIDDGYEEPQEDNVEEALQGLGLDLNVPDMDMSLNNSFDTSAHGIEPNADSTANISLSSVLNNQMPSGGNWLDVNYLQNLEKDSRNQYGPSSWKVHRLAARLREQNAEGAPKRRKAAVQAPPIINFTAELPDVDLEELFEPATKEPILSAKYFNPEDNHTREESAIVTLTDFMGLSLRPASGIAPLFKRMAQNPNQSLAELPDMSFANFGANDEDLNNEDDRDMGMDMDMDMSMGPMDEEPLANFDDGIDYNQEISAQTRAADLFFKTNAIDSRSQPEGQIKFSKSAKKVDVRKLKDNVLHAITEKEQQTSLLNVIKETQPSYSAQDRHNLSPAMYFISMLHLCNEEGFTLANTPELNDIIISH